MKKLLLTLLVPAVLLSAGCKDYRMPGEREADRLEARYQHMLEAKQGADQVAAVRAHYKSLGVDVSR